MPFAPDDEPEFVPPHDAIDDGLTTFVVSVDPSPIPSVEVDRVGNRKLTATDWLKIASWAAIYPIVLGLIIDVLLYVQGGYDATITASSRLAIRHHPKLIGGMVGTVFGGLAMHFFGSFPGAALSREAAISFAVCIPIGGFLVYTFFYG